jgi:UDPglucose 6-dehydrogenase
MQKGCHIAAYDPAARERAREVLSSKVEFAASAYEAARDADALLILTEWEEFAALDLDQLYRELKYPIVIDGRNLYDPQIMAAHGFTYWSIGRAVAIPESGVAVTPRRFSEAETSPLSEAAS